MGIQELLSRLCRRISSVGVIGEAVPHSVLARYDEPEGPPPSTGRRLEEARARSADDAYTKPYRA